MSVYGPVLLPVLEKYAITFTTGGASYCLSIIEEASKQNKTTAPNSLTQVLVSGSLAAKLTKERINSYFKYSKLFEIYGSTELGMITMLTPAEIDTETALGSVGKEPAGVPAVSFLHSDGSLRANVVKTQASEVVATTPMIFLEYWNRADLNSTCWTSNKMFRTGDVGYRNENGYLVLLGRSDDRISKFCCTITFACSNIFTSKFAWSK